MANASSDTMVGELGLARVITAIRGRLAAITALAFALLLGIAPVARAEMPKPAIAPKSEAPEAVLYVGNSFFYYNNSLHNHVLRLARESDPSRGYHATSATISGSGLDWHDVDDLLSRPAMGSYTFTTTNEVRPVRRQPKFNAVVMMDCSQCPIHPDLKGAFADAVAKDAAIVRKHKAEPVLFMSWAYADKPEMTDQLAEAYTRVANANGTLVIPAGLAFARARRERPELNLYAEDLRHPSPAGTYLAACTVLASLYHRSPVGNAYRAGLDDVTAAFLQQIAWQTVQDFYATQ